MELGESKRGGLRRRRREKEEGRKMTLGGKPIEAGSRVTKKKCFMSSETDSFA